MKSDALPLPALQRIEAAITGLLHAIRALGPSAGMTANVRSPCLVDVVNEFLLAKARAGRSDRYLSLMLKQLRSFVRGRERTPASLVTVAEIERWLYAQGWVPKTQHGALLTLRTMFEFALARSYVASNPARAVDLPALQSPPPGIHTPGEARQVLERCQDPSTLRFLAIPYFAGLRGSEAEALAESEILLDRGLIEVTAVKAKTQALRW